MAKCLICFQDTRQFTRLGDRDAYSYSCFVCGDYVISATAKVTIRNEIRGRENILSGYFRERKLLGMNPLELTSSNIEEVFSSFVPPRTVSEKVDRLINYFGSRSEAGSNYIAFQPEIDYPISYARNQDDFNLYLQYLRDEELIANHAKGNYLTFKGWKRYEELQRNPPRIDQAFVAMWYGKSDAVDRVNEMSNLYHRGIKNAIEDADLSPKVKALRIDLVEHNDPIDNRILVEIRKSRFMIADFTGHRGGVYFEAGYALAHGIPVIWTCKSDEADKMHFDTRQFSRIEWNNPEDLYGKLKRRIEGSIF